MRDRENTDYTEETRTGHLVCHWKDCGQLFPDHTALASHLSEGKQTQVVIKRDEQLETKCTHKTMLVGNEEDIIANGLIAQDKAPNVTIGLHS